MLLALDWEVLCLDYGNKILNHKMLRGEEKELLVPVYVISSF